MKYAFVVLLWVIYGVAYVASDYLISRPLVEHQVQAQFEGNGSYMDSRPKNELWMFYTVANVAISSFVLYPRKK